MLIKGDVVMLTVRLVILCLFILCQDVGDGYISYTLPLVFTLFVSARDQVFHHADIIVSRVLEQPGDYWLRMNHFLSDISCLNHFLYDLELLV